MKQKTDDSAIVSLITDGGSENVNMLVDNFIEQQNGRLLRRIAMKDIAFSNSAIEAVNKVLIPITYL